MAYRGRGRGRGRGGYGYGYGQGGAKQEPFELFPVIDGFGTAEYSDAKIQLIRWSTDLHKHWKSSPYYYEDRRQRPAKAQKPDIERYSDRNLQKSKAKLELRDWIMLDRDHIPAELAEGERKRKRAGKRIQWNPELGQDIFEKLEKMSEGKEEETEKKENEDEEEEDGEIEEEQGEYSDEGDYEQNKDFDDDEDDFNMADDGNDEPLF